VSEEEMACDVHVCRCATAR